MEAKELRGKAAIAGFGDSYWPRGGREVKTPMRLAAEAARAALADAGLKKDDIDGVLTCRAPLADMRPQWQNIFCSYLKIVPRYASEITIHGAGVNSMLKHAAMAVATGVARNVLCVNGDAPGLIDMKSAVPQVDADPVFELPYGPMIPALYAQSARRLMYEYGVTEDQLSAVAVQSQNWAIHHPYAAKAYLGPFTIERVNSSPMVASPLRLLHMAPWGPPGTGAAFIVTSAENARAMNDRPIYILGSGECETHEYITDRLALRRSPVDLGKLPNITSTGCKTAADIAYKMAGLGPKDMDIVQVASNFAHIEMIVLSELGFCDKREVGDFILSGVIDVGGKLPTNTNGGWLSFGQAGAACAQDSITEAVRQLRGTALGKQVSPRPEVAIVHGIGGMVSCHSVTILSTSL